LSELKDYVDAAYSPPFTNLRTGEHIAESTGVGMLPGQEVIASESDHYLWAMNCPPICSAQSNNMPRIAPLSALNSPSSTCENLGKSQSLPSADSQMHIGSCTSVANQWPWALSAASPRELNSLNPHQPTQDKQLAVSSECQSF
jgi:hypothetical protein